MVNHFISRYVSRVDKSKHVVLVANVSVRVVVAVVVYARASTMQRRIVSIRTLVNVFALDTLEWPWHASSREHPPILLPLCVCVCEFCIVQRVSLRFSCRYRLADDDDDD